MRKPTADTFDARIDAERDRISPAELRVVQYFQTHREEALVASASDLATRIGTSDATVVRTARALGFSGLKEMRQALAADIRDNPSPASRMTRTLHEVGDDLEAAFAHAMDVHQGALDGLRRDISPQRFRGAVDLIGDAARIFIFGIGPSSAMADYFATQLGRFGREAHAMTRTGLLLADDLGHISRGDLVIVFAYGRVYTEVEVLLDRIDAVGAKAILVSDTLGSKLGKRVDLTLPVARGRTGMLSMHTATLALIETLLVGVAAAYPKETLAGLEALNRNRARLAGNEVKL